MPATAYIAIGANIEPERNILAALEKLNAAAPIAAVSTFYRTPAIGRPEQPAYLNGVAAVHHGGGAHALKYAILRPIETALGRVRTEDKYAARTIDLDIVLYGGAVLDEPGLRLPDPDLRTRPFIARPLLEIAPDLTMPDTGNRLEKELPPETAVTLEADTAFSALLRQRFAR